MAALTIYLSRLIGLLTLIAALSMLADKPQAIDTVRAVIQDRSALLILGMLGTAAGLAVVLGHQVWSGGCIAGVGDGDRLDRFDPRHDLAVSVAACDRSPRRLVSLRRVFLSLRRICCGSRLLYHRSRVQRRCRKAAPEE